MKKCYKCKKHSCLNDFHKDKSRKDGLCNLCKECKKTKDKGNRKNRKRYNLKYYSNNISKYKKYNSRRRELHRIDPRIRLRGGCRARAIEKGLDFDLKSYKDLPKVPKFCPILGIPLICGKGKNFKGGGTDNSPSTDRIDNDRGYLKDNIQIISRKANQMKSNATFEDVEMLYKYMKKQRRKQCQTMTIITQVSYLDKLKNKVINILTLLGIVK